MSERTAAEPHRVVIVGGGVAGLEALMALRSIAGSRVGITLVEPARDFVYRAQAVGEPFGMDPAQRHPIDRIAADFGAQLVPDRLERVAPEAGRVLLEGGSDIGYETLILALGARQQPAWPHVVTFRGPRDTAAMGAIVSDIEHGRTESAAFVVPAGVSWPLPLYELALMTARRAPAGAELAIFTPEREPLEVFGREVSSKVAAELDAAGVRVARSTAVDVTPQGDVVMPFEETPLRFEQVVALPRLAGPSPRGVACDAHGFIEIDSHGGVRGMRHVYAAGDGTDYPIKQGGIAAQHADAVAEAVAKVVGAGNTPRPFSAVLRAELFTGTGSRFLRGELSPRASELSEVSETPLWWPAGKIAGAYLGPYLAARTAQPDPEREQVAITTSWIEESPYGE
jgi:sulfide:quinone oxidoreductase